MRFEIINPSDPYVMEACDLEVAAVAICLLGEGQYSLKGLAGDAGTDVPFFMLGGVDAWFTEKFGRNFQDTVNRVVSDRVAELAAALDSVTLARGERSSLNDIGRQAAEMAQVLRERAGKQEATAR